MFLCASIEQRGLRVASAAVCAATIVAAAVAHPTAAGAAVTPQQLVSADGSGRITTQAFSTSSPNDLVVAFAASDGPASGGQTLTVGGAGLAWRLVRRANAQPGSSEIWMAIAPAPLANVTVSSTQSIGGYHQSVTVVSFTGAGGVGASGSASGANGAPGVILTTTQAGALVYGVGNDWDNARAPVLAANQTLVHQDVDTAVNDTYWVQRGIDPIAAAGTLVAVADTAPTADRWNFAGVEITPAPSGPARTGVAIEQLVSTDGAGPVTTSSFSTSVPGEVMVVFAASDGPASGGQMLTVSGGGLTWNLVRRANAQLGTSEIWSATAPGRLSNVTVRSTPRIGGFHQSVTVAAFTGAGGVGTSAAASAPNGAPAVPLTTTQPGSLVMGVGNDWDHATSRTPAANQLTIHQTVDTGTDDTYWVQSVASAMPAAGASIQLADTAPTTDQWNFAAVEILAAATPVTTVLSAPLAPIVFANGSGAVTTPPFSRSIR